MLRFRKAICRGGALLLALALLAACGDDDGADATASQPGSESGTTGSLPTGVTGTTGSEPTTGTTGTDGPTQTALTESRIEPAPLPVYSGGDCPPMDAGRVQLNSAGRDREVAIDLPAEPRDAPVLFVYHGNGSNAAQFQSFFQTARIASEFGVIVVTPESTGSFQVEWPLLGQEDKAVDETLFTDVLTCLNEAHGIDRTRVYTTGFSAGGLWSTWLAMHMSEYLASAVIFAGGTSTLTFGYTSPGWQIPILATHGGPEDIVIINFQTTTMDLVRNLVGDGHLTVLCTHDEGHIITWNIPDLAMPWLLSHSFGEVDESYREGLDASWPPDCELFEE